MATLDDCGDTLPTPFAQDSFEGRFAFDGKKISPDLLILGLRCCLAMNGRILETEEDEFTGYAVSSTRLAVALTLDGRLYPMSDHTHFTSAKMAVATDLICRWLQDTAKYPQRPWFDGGEAKGFQMFYVPWSKGYELYQGFQGYTLIEPKWFEVHK